MKSADVASVGIALALFWDTESSGQNDVTLSKGNAMKLWKSVAVTRSLRIMILSLLPWLAAMGMACGGDVSSEEFASADPTADSELRAGKAADALLYYSVRPDTRRCISPICGGYFIKAVNQAKTRCADGVSRPECYVTSIDFSQTGLSNEDLSLMQSGGEPILYHGTQQLRVYEGFGQFAVLMPVDCWRASSPELGTGTFFALSNNGRVCITAPCFTIDEQKLNAAQSTELSGLEGRAQLVEGAFAAMADNTIVVTGENKVVRRAGPAGNGKVAVINQYFVQVQHTMDACARVRCAAGTHCVAEGDSAACIPNSPSCGGIAGIACPGAGSCVDDPSDDCDPSHGGADCGGICECRLMALCVGGMHWDRAPNVCACVAD